MKKKDLPEERGRILDRWVSLETCITMIISQHYFGTEDLRKNDFQYNIIENPKFSWGLKRDCLAHILRSDNLDATNLDDLDRLNSIRNTFAHRQYITKDTPQTEDSEVFFIHTKHPFDRARNLSARSLKEEFDHLFPVVFNWLYELLRNKGMSLPAIANTLDRST